MRNKRCHNLTRSMALKLKPKKCRSLSIRAGKSVGFHFFLGDEEILSNVAENWLPPPLLSDSLPKRPNPRLYYPSQFIETVFMATLYFTLPWTFNKYKHLQFSFPWFLILQQRACNSGTITGTKSDMIHLPSPYIYDRLVHFMNRQTVEYYKYNFFQWWQFRKVHSMQKLNSR